MVTEVNNPISKRIAESFVSTETNAETAYAEKKSEYDAAMKAYFTQKDQLWYAEREFMFDRKNPETKQKYFNIKSNADSSCMNADILRDSLQSRIFSLAKVRNSVSIFNSTVG